MTNVLTFYETHLAFGAIGLVRFVPVEVRGMEASGAELVNCLGRLVVVMQWKRIIIINVRLRPVGLLA